jgi:protein-S-isoprenylcysteine O-methyltransferase Ste14
MAAVLMLLGGLGSLWALGGLGRHLSMLPHPKDGAPLVLTGAYAWVRHPIYVFVLLLGGGWALAWRSAAAGAAWAALALLFDLKARREERLLAERFPAYEAYRRRVARFIPHLY